MRRELRKFWYTSKEIIFSERGNSGLPAQKVIFESYEKARRDCSKYAGPQYPCSYCNGKRHCTNINIKKIEEWPDEYKVPPPGAKDLKIIARKAGEAWIAKYTVKCEKCGLEETAEFYDNMYSSYDSRKRASGSGGCFIATAVYGNASAQEVVIMRRFRDEVLLTYTIGKVFTNAYNQISPNIANLVSRHNILKTLFKLLFRPVTTLLLHIYTRNVKIKNPTIKTRGNTPST